MLEILAFMTLAALATYLTMTLHNQIVIQEIKSHYEDETDRIAEWAHNHGYVTGVRRGWIQEANSRKINQ